MAKSAMARDTRRCSAKLCGEAATLAGRRLQLGWYGRPGESLPALGPGSRWLLQVRLRPPRGVVNPGGFDFERRALERRIAATGQIPVNGDVDLT